MAAAADSSRAQTELETASIVRAGCPVNKARLTDGSRTRYYYWSSNSISMRTSHSGWGKPNEKVLCANTTTPDYLKTHGS